jgi:hypothetical protein
MKRFPGLVPPLRVKSQTARKSLFDKAFSFLANPEKIRLFA